MLDGEGAVEGGAAGGLFTEGGWGGLQEEQVRGGQVAGGRGERRAAGLRPLCCGMRAFYQLIREDSCILHG